MKQWHELEYILNMLEYKNQSTRRWVKRIRKSIADKSKGIKTKCDSNYIPKYILEVGSLRVMERNMLNFKLHLLSDICTLIQEERGLQAYLNESIRRNSIYNLRVAIYQTCDATQELRPVKKQMIQSLPITLKKLFADFLRYS